MILLTLPVRVLSEDPKPTRFFLSSSFIIIFFGGVGRLTLAAEHTRGSQIIAVQPGSLEGSSLPSYAIRTLQHFSCSLAWRLSDG